MEDANLFPPSTTTTPRLSYLAHKNTQEGHDIELMEETSPEVIPNDFTKKNADMIVILIIFSSRST